MGSESNYVRIPIEPDDIRKGDLIRFEYGPAATHATSAYKYRAGCDGDSIGVGGQHFLLLRPERMVQVPESAIEKLRAQQRDAYRTYGAVSQNGRENLIRRLAIDAFLEAVEQANEAGDTDD